MKYLLTILFHMLLIPSIALAGSGFEPVINEIINDVIGKTVSKDTINKTSERMTQFADIYHDAKTVPNLPNTIKESVGTPTPRARGTATATKARTAQKPTFWQKIDKLILKMQNSNN